MIGLMMAAQAAIQIAAPVPLTAQAAGTADTAATRALDLEGVTALPATPMSFTFQCLVLPTGTVISCIAADDGGTRDAAAFARRTQDLRQAVAADPIRRAALARVRRHRLPPVRADTSGRSVLIRETVSAADAGPAGAAVATVDKHELVFEPGWNPQDFYPLAALRAEAATRVGATCRVLADHSLLCRDARTDLPPNTGEQPMWRVPALDPDFARATVQALAAARVRPTLASGGDSVGREARLTIRWALP